MSPEAAAVVVALISGPVLAYQNYRQSRALKKVERATTDNGHRDPENPTLRDDLGDIRQALALLTTKVDAHLTWSEEEMQRIWRAVLRK